MKDFVEDTNFGRYKITEITRWSKAAHMAFGKILWRSKWFLSFSNENGLVLLSAVRDNSIEENLESADPNNSFPPYWSKKLCSTSR